MCNLTARRIEGSEAENIFEETMAENFPNLRENFTHLRRSRNC